MTSKDCNSVDVQFTYSNDTNTETKMNSREKLCEEKTHSIRVKLVLLR